MTDLERFGFKMRSDGSMVYRDSEKAIKIHPTVTGWAIAIQMRRWAGGVHRFSPRASTPDAAALFIFDWLADEQNI